ncbi:MAG: hypothetical protein JXA60_07065 [Candidatus Coatesbacteria bacterium]|nr:hypothetical protein [Candidatus Coatesbacteria bacterium]
MRLNRGSIIPSWLNDTLISEFRYFPLTTARDIYKLLYQSIMGSSHLITKDILLIRKEFLDEWTNADISRTPIPFQIISPRFLRCHFCSCKFHEIEAKEVLNSFILSASISNQDFDLFRSLWKNMIEDHHWGIILKKFDDFSEINTLLAQKTLPLMHHSQIYRDTYKPAYRVISREIAEKEIKNFAIFIK